VNIPFNKPLVLGSEKDTLAEVIESKSFSANGVFTQKCHQFLEQQLNYKKALLTTSCTAALEMAAQLMGILPDDEVIIPSYAFVTTANAFASKGAKIVFADSQENHPSIDDLTIESLITSKTKAIVALHYGGVACNMEPIMAIAKKHSVWVVEDNAQGVGSTLNGKPLGGIGHMGVLSFHETKNIHCGEGGALLVNADDFSTRAPIVWDMGTNKAEYKIGKVKSYGWVDLGSSYYPSELNAAFLNSQLHELSMVNNTRLTHWRSYFNQFAQLERSGHVKRPQLNVNCKHNAHTFYLLTRSIDDRDELISFLAQKGISATFHFQSLHRSAYFADKHSGAELPNSDRFSNTLVRLPLYHSLLKEEQGFIVDMVYQFYQK
jgi:dTDP-4-amino-4,6-dideoxygalactose transaminase